jgi:plasmid stability protein
VVNLTVRNIPENILKRVRIFAVRERRSMNSELLILLENGLKERIREETGMSDSGEEREVSSVPGILRESLWKELAGQWKDERSIQTLVNEVYDARNGEKIL